MKRRWVVAVVALCAVFSFSFLASNQSQAAIVTLDFTKDDGDKTLVHGQVIATDPSSDAQPGDPVAEFGNLVSVSTLQGPSGHKGAVIFDSSKDGPGKTLGDPDTDLLVNRGNILTLQDPQRPGKNTVPGNGFVFKNPDDTREPNAGSIVFTFLQPVAPISVDIVDADAGFGMDVILTDTQGRTRTYSIHEKWTFDISVHGPKGYDTLVLNAIFPQDGEGYGTDGQPNTPDDFTTVTDLGLDGLNVKTIEFKFRGHVPVGWSSGGIDNLTFDDNSIPEPSSVAMILLASAVGLAARRRLGRG